MKKRKIIRILSFVLSFLLIFSFLALSIYAKEKEFKDELADEFKEGSQNVKDSFKNLLLRLAKLLPALIVIIIIIAIITVFEKLRKKKNEKDEKDGKKDNSDEHDNE